MVEVKDRIARPNRVNPPNTTKDREGSIDPSEEHSDSRSNREGGHWPLVDVKGGGRCVGRSADNKVDGGAGTVAKKSKRHGDSNWDVVRRWGRCCERR